MSLKLVEDKYLRKIRRPNAKKGKAFQKGPQLPPFEFIMAERERLCQEYFNPTFKIEKYVSFLTLCKDWDFRVKTDNL